MKHAPAVQADHYRAGRLHLARPQLESAARRLSVDRKVYDRFPEGSSVLLREKPGFLGAPWVEGSD